MTDTSKEALGRMLAEARNQAFREAVKKIDEWFEAGNTAWGDYRRGWKDGLVGAKEEIEALIDTPPREVSVQEAAKVLLEAGDKVLLKLANGYDCEDSAQRGEPNPHEIDEIFDDAEWVSERIACASEGLRALAEGEQDENN